jgi:CRISPR/Cas system-associated exonuclease Cas4 (RecB family)
LSAYVWLLAKNAITVCTGKIVYADMEKLLRIAINLLPLDEIEQVLTQAAELFMAEDLPPFLVDEDALWECDYCPVRDICEEEAGHQVGKAMNTELAKFEAEAAEVA